MREDPSIENNQFHVLSINIPGAIIKNRHYVDKVFKKDKKLRKCYNKAIRKGLYEWIRNINCSSCYLLFSYLII